jgi:hypothetical protein
MPSIISQTSLFLSFPTHDSDFQKSLLVGGKGNQAEKIVRVKRIQLKFVQGQCAFENPFACSLSPSKN